jgi:hypothetical protein
LTTNVVAKGKHFAPFTITTCNQALFLCEDPWAQSWSHKKLVELWRQQLLKATLCASWIWQWGQAISTQRKVWSNLLKLWKIEDNNMAVVGKVH